MKISKKAFHDDETQTSIWDYIHGVNNMSEPNLLWPYLAVCITPVFFNVISNFVKISNLKLENHFIMQYVILN